MWKLLDRDLGQELGLGPSTEQTSERSLGEGALLGDRSLTGEKGNSPKSSFDGVLSKDHIAELEELGRNVLGDITSSWANNHPSSGVAYPYATSNLPVALPGAAVKGYVQAMARLATKAATKHRAVTIAVEVAKSTGLTALGAGLIDAGRAYAREVQERNRAQGLHVFHDHVYRPGESGYMNGPGFEK
jgi:hypothetical protein